MIIIVLGMHKSGTSALSGLLHNCGIVMGSKFVFKPKPARENPLGFYENCLFRKMSEKLLKNSGYRTKKWLSEVPELKSNIVDRIRMKFLIRVYNTIYPFWGWKDPRLCLTLNIWLDVLKELNLLYKCKFIFIFREPKAVVASMIKRGNIINCKGALELWKKYNDDAIKIIENKKLNTFYVNYGDLINNPLVVSKHIFNFLKFDYKEEIVRGFIKPGLNRSSSFTKKLKLDDFELELQIDKFYSDLSLRVSY